MPQSSKNGGRRGSPEAEKSRRGKLPEKSMSFHGKAPMMPPPSAAELRRPKTVPELLSRGQIAATPAPPPATAPRLTKLLLNVTIQGSLGPVQVLMSPDWSVGDLIIAAVRLYVKEGRRPFLPASEPSQFDLHYSQFSLESIGRSEKLISLGSRNFFLCSQKAAAAAAGEHHRLSSCAAVAKVTCSEEAEKATKIGFQFLKFMGF